MSTMSDNLCLHCNKKFTQRRNLYAHMRNLHPEETVEMHGNLECNICSAKLRQFSDLHNHYKLSHPEILSKFETQTFSSMDKYTEWLDSFETATKSKFIQRNKSTWCDKTVKYLICHRSRKGPESNCIERHQKHKGTNKINKTCPATIKVIVYNKGDITVEVQSTHDGHEFEISRIPLKKSDKDVLAAKMAQGIPKPRILADIRSEFSVDNRLSFTTTKDLHNICRDYKIGENVITFDKNDSQSVHLKINRLKKEPENCILLYKPLGEMAYDLPENEFVLGLMSNAQQKVFELHNDTIMIDSTHGMNAYGIPLTTIMVNDHNHEGFPVACLYSSKENYNIFKLFFEEIKKRMPLLKARIFLSDDCPSYYNAWQDVFGECEYHLLCTWHVKKAWKLNLRNKIKDTELREKVSKDLEKLHVETHITTFERYLSSFMELYENNEATFSFIQYFKSHYLERTKLWAYCYRVGCKVNTNTKLERWHRQLKYEEAGGTVIKRMDKSIAIVLTAIAKKVTGHIIYMERNKVNSKVALIRLNHKKTLEMSQYQALQMSDKQWIISKSQDRYINTYEISKQDGDCSCELKCHLCNVCIHKYTCTCIEYCIKYNICKHIHFICTKFKNEMQISKIQKSDEKINEPSDIPEASTKESLQDKNERKQILVAKFLKFIDEAETEEKLKLIEESAEELESKLLFHSIDTFKVKEKHQPQN